MFNFWPHVFNSKSREKGRIWRLLYSMCHLDLKITFLCLRPGLNFNLQTLVCICYGLGLLPCGRTAGPHYKGPDIHSGVETSLVVTARQSGQFPRKLQHTQVRSLSLQHVCMVTGSQPCLKKTKRIFYFICCRPSRLPRQKYSLKKKKNKINWFFF